MRHHGVVLRGPMRHDCSFPHCVQCILVVNNTAIQFHHAGPTSSSDRQIYLHVNPRSPLMEQLGHGRLGIRLAKKEPSLSALKVSITVTKRQKYLQGLTIWQKRVGDFSRSRKGTLEHLGHTLLSKLDRSQNLTRHNENT